MTDRLREALHTTAADVPVYPVHDRAVATARRTRRRTVVAAAALLVFVALAGTVFPGTSAVAPAAGAGAALPDRVGVPPFGSLHATDRPRLGAASVIFTGQADGLRWGDEGSIIAVVGAETDRYRIVKGENEVRAGEDAVLSPDGRRVAFREVGGWTRPRVEIVDLVTGHSRTVATGVSGTVMADPMAWSPDGRTLVVRDTVPANPELSAYTHVLSLVGVDGDRRTRLAEAGDADGLGSPVAFAPNGALLAFQSGRTVVVANVDGRRLDSFDLPPDTELAGKGAWSTDSRTLTLAQRDGGSWRLRSVDAGPGMVLGRDLGGLDTPEVSGVTAIRLLGWAADGSARVVAYQPAPDPRIVGFDLPLEMDQRLAYGNVGTVRVLALGRGAPAPTTLLVAPDGVVAIDVADTVIHSGRSRAANPPDGIGPRFWFWTVLVIVLLAAIVAYRCRRGLALWLDDRRVGRTRRKGESGIPRPNG